MSILRTEDLQKTPRERWTLLYHILDSLNRTCEHLGWDYFGADIKNESRCIASVRETDTPWGFEFHVVVDLVLSPPLEVRIQWVNLPVSRTSEAQEQKEAFRRKLVVGLEQDLLMAIGLDSLARQQFLNAIAIIQATPPSSHITLNTQTRDTNETDLVDGKKRNPRGPDPDVLEECKQAMGYWLDQSFTLGKSAEKVGRDKKTILKWIPNVLEMVDKDRRATWIALIRAQGKENHLGKFRDV